MGYLTRGDSTLFRGFFKEAARLRGIHCQYYYVIHPNETIYGEVNPEYSQPIEIDIIFDTNPKTRTLKAINWVSEYGDDKPYIAYLPYDVPHLSTHSKLVIPPIDSLQNQGKSFKITTINTLLEFPDCWTCTVVPIFETEDSRNNYEETNSNYIKTQDDPDKDSPENTKNFDVLTADKTNKNFKFLNVEED